MQLVFSLQIHAPRKKVFYVEDNVRLLQQVPSLTIFFTTFDLPCFDWTGWDTLSHCCHCTTSSKRASFMTMSSQAGHLSHLFIVHFSLVLSQTKWSTNDPEYQRKLGTSLHSKEIHRASSHCHGTGRGKLVVAWLLAAKHFLASKSRIYWTPFWHGVFPFETFQMSLSMTILRASFRA